MIRDRRLAIHETRGADILRRILHVGDIGQLYCRAVVIADDQRLVIHGFQQLVIVSDVRAAGSIDNLPFRRIGSSGGSTSR